jgi:hypothetical protein
LHDTSLTTDEESLKIHSEMMISQFFFSIPRFFLLKSPIFVGELHGKFPRKKSPVSPGSTRGLPLHGRAACILHKSPGGEFSLGTDKPEVFFPLGIELGIYLKVS